MKRIKKTALSAILAALSVVLLYAGSLLGKIDIATAAVASVCVMITQCEFGYKRAIAVYLVTAVVSLVLVPSKTAPVLFTVLFGLYPVVKNYSESRFGKTAAYIIKYIYLNAAVAVLFVFVCITLAILPMLFYPIVILCANALLPVYDRLLSFGAAVYYNKVRTKFR